MIVVANSSPLISLSAINSLHLLRSLYATIYIPLAVYQEVVVIGKGKAGAKEVAGALWIRCRHVQSARVVSELMVKTHLDEGESEAIVLAQELRANLLIIDDQKARDCARELGISATGTMGILLLGKERGLISSVKALLDELVSMGVYLDAKTCSRILRKAGEE